MSVQEKSNGELEPIGDIYGVRIYKTDVCPGSHIAEQFVIFKVCFSFKFMSLPNQKYMK